MPLCGNFLTAFNFDFHRKIEKKTQTLPWYHCLRYHLVSSLNLSFFTSLDDEGLRCELNCKINSRWRKNRVPLDWLRIQGTQRNEIVSFSIAWHRVNPFPPYSDLYFDHGVFRKWRKWRKFEVDMIVMDHTCKKYDF